MPRREPSNGFFAEKPLIPTSTLGRCCKHKLLSGVTLRPSCSLSTAVLTYPIL